MQSSEKMMFIDEFVCLTKKWNSSKATLLVDFKLFVSHVIAMRKFAKLFFLLDLRLQIYFAYWTQIYSSQSDFIQI